MKMTNLTIAGILLMLIATHFMKPVGVSHPSIKPTQSTKPQKEAVLAANTCSTTPADVLIVLDHSSSMSDTDPSTGLAKLAAAKTAANTFIDLISENVPNTNIGAIQFAASGSYPNSKTATTVVAPLSANYAVTKTAITAIPGIAQGSDPDGTCFECAFDMANNLFSSSGRSGARKIMIFITDGMTQQIIGSEGQDVAVSTAESRAMAKITDGLNQGVLSNTIGIGSGANNIDEGFLQQISTASQGTYFNDPAYGTLQQIFQAIFAQDFPMGKITGTVFNDTNYNGILNPKDAGLPNFSIQLSGASTQTAVSNVAGTYTFSNLCDGAYTVKEVVPSPWLLTSAASLSPTISGGNTSANNNFGNSLGYTISGNVFNDLNENGIQDPGEVNYLGNSVVTASIGNVTTSPNGTYTISNLPPGKVTVSFRSLPSGYNMTSPRNGPPPSFQVTVGNACDTNKSPGASCQ